MSALALSELKNKGIVTIDTLLMPKSFDDEIKFNELLANVFVKVIENNSYYSEIPVKVKDKKTGKYHQEIKKWINISGWSFIDRVLKITPHITNSELKLVKREKASERLEYCVTCELRTVDGVVIATGLAKASSGEPFKQDYTESKLESLASSRSVSKTHRLYFQDILEKLNLNNDLIIEGDFVEKSSKRPENATELVDEHTEMMKKYSFKSDEDIDKQSQKLKDDIKKENDIKKNKDLEKSNKPKISGGVSRNKEITEFFKASDYEKIDADLLVENAIASAKKHLEETTAEANVDMNDVRNFIILHKDELQSIRPGLADDCVKKINEAKK